MSATNMLNWPTSARIEPGDPVIPDPGSLADLGLTWGTAAAVPLTSRWRECRRDHQSFSLLEVRQYDFFSPSPSPSSDSSAPLTCHAVTTTEK